MTTVEASNVKLQVLFQFLFATLVTGAWLYLILSGRPVPSDLSTVVNVVIGVYFGAQINQMIKK